MNRSLNFTSVNWIAPPISQLNFSTECTIVAAWARTWLSEGSGVEVRATADHFRQALPAELRDIPTDGQLVDWFNVLLMIRQETTMNGTMTVYNSSNPDPWWNITINPFKACLDEVCQTIPWSGVPDITGPGVMTSAWIQAILSTIFTLLAAWEGRLRRERIVPSKRLQLIFYAFRGALGVFVDGALIMSLCINIAAIVLIASRSNEGGIAQLVLAHDIAIFSFAACLLPAMVHEHMHDSEGNDKKGSRNLFFFLNLILYMIVANTVPVFASNYEQTNSWEVYCFWDIIPTERQVTLILLGVISYSLWALLFFFYLLPWALMKWRFLKAVKWLKRSGKVITTYIILATGLFVWYMLLTITVVRQLLLKRSGFGSDDARMSFGQVLSLGTWLPVFIELYYLFKNGLPSNAGDSNADGKAAPDNLSGLTITDAHLNSAAIQESAESRYKATDHLLGDIQRPGMSSHRISNASSVLSLESDPTRRIRTSATF